MTDRAADLDLVAAATSSDSEAAPRRAALEIEVAAPATAARAAAILGQGRTGWLGPVREAVAPAGLARYLVDLALPVGERGRVVTFHKAALVDVGPVETGPDGVAVEIGWRAAGMAPLFPVFAGRLAWRDGVLRLRGLYAPPGGGVGLVADRLLLNLAARGTARRLLEQIAAAMRPEG